MIDTAFDNDIDDVARKCIIYVSPYIMQEWVTVGSKMNEVLCIAGLPDGAIYCGAFVQESPEAIGLIFEHSSFDPVPSGSPIPVMQVEHKKIVRKIFHMESGAGDPIPCKLDASTEEEH